jgi:hypothetical protein
MEKKNKQKWMITGVTPMTMEAPPYESLSKWIDDHPPSGLWISLQNHQMSQMFDHLLKIAPFFEGDPAEKSTRTAVPNATPMVVPQRIGSCL